MLLVILNIHEHLPLNQSLAICYKIQVFQPNGAFLRVIGRCGGLEDRDGEFALPTCLAFNLDGDLLVSDRGHSEIQLLNPDSGLMILKFGHWGCMRLFPESHWGLEDDNTALNNPRGLVVDRENNIIQMFTSKGVWIRHFGEWSWNNGQFSTPSDVAIDPSTGNIIVLESDPSRIQIFDSHLVLTDNNIIYLQQMDNF